MSKRILIVLFFLSFRLASLWAQQNNQYQFSQLNITNGLSSNQVNAIFKDSKGFMWFGTLSGLNRYDGYQFKVFKHSLGNPGSLSDGFVSGIFEGPGEKLWIQTRSATNIYDPAKETFDRHPELYLKSIGVDTLVSYIVKTKTAYWFIANGKVFVLRNKSSKASKLPLPSSLTVTHISADSRGNIWIIYSNGLLELRNPQTFRLLYQIKTNAKGALRAFVDKQDELWLYATDIPQGIFYYQPALKTLSHFYKGSSVPLNNNIINGIVQDDNGAIWIATDHGGINVLDKKKLHVSYLLNREGDPKSVAQNSVITIYKDNAGFIWTGTYKRGISYYNQNLLKFPLYQHQPFNPNSLPYDDVNRFVEDAKGNLWIGTNGGGLIYFNRKTNSFTQYRHQQGKENSLSNDVIVSLCMDRKQKLWIGTYFGGLDCFDGKVFTHYKHDPANPNSLADDRVWEILEDSKGNLWIGTLTSGMDVFDRRTKTFKHYKPNAPNSIHSTYVSALAEDAEGNLWIGTSDGVDLMEKKSGKFTRLVYNENNSHSLSNNFIISLYRDSRGLMWVGTREGLNYCHSRLRKFKALRSTDGLADNTILTILEDAGGNIWVSTPKGLSSIQVKPKGKDFTFSFKNYDEQDGLQGREFNENAALRTSRNELVFGGPNGFNIFQPEKIKANSALPKLIFTDFSLFNNSVGINEVIDGKVLLDSSITVTKEITLNHNQNIFAIEFAALGYSNPEKNKYAYTLEGFNDKWLFTDGKLRKATYTNLDPGEYTFKVKAANDNGLWNETPLSIRINILPPFWKTKLAYFIYLLIIFGSLYAIRRRGINKLKAQFALEQERQEARRMHELDMVKIKFFTNVSHEFRTPLALILAPVEKMLSQSNDSDKRNQLQMVHRNARRLLNLVNQLLDFRKMEVRELKLQARPGNVIEFIKDSFYSFTDMADKKNISFSFKSDIEQLITSFDHDKIERILFNVLSNAFKFTAQNGSISLEIASIIKAELTSLEIRIKDSGIGIAPENLTRIFDRFFQNEVPGSMVNQGSGIGLAITKEFVSLHGGSIRVESELDKGSCFIINFDFKALETPSPARVAIEEFSEPEFADTRATEFNHKKRTILLVEDNEDFRFYLKDNLKLYFNIIESGNGKNGWVKALSAHPDLIVSDISMPEMNGIDLCMKLKADKRTSNIPVILLTALTGEEQQLKGLETGANDYMSKPFNFEILLSKIRNLIQQQEAMKKTYIKQVEANPLKLEVESADEKFIQHALQILEKNISRPEYSVEEFSSGLNLSRVALYKKLLALTGKTPIEFIRSFRLKRAAQLLEESQLTVAEIAYEVGFNNPKYFAKYFKNEFGVVPSAYAEMKRNKA